MLDDVVSADLVQREWQSLEQEYEHLEVSGWTSAAGASPAAGDHVL